VKCGRRNQVLFSLSRLEHATFTTREIEKILKDHFIEFISGIPFRVSAELSGLCKRDNPIIKKVPNSNEYSFTDPRYIMALRTLLTNSAGSVQVIKFRF